MSDVEHRTFGRRLAAIRSHRQVSQAELAAVLGVGKASIAHWEHGRAAPRRPRLEQIARALHCRVADLLAPLDAPLPRLLRRRLQPA